MAPPRLSPPFHPAVWSPIEANAYLLFPFLLTAVATRPLFSFYRVQLRCPSIERGEKNVVPSFPSFFFFPPLRRPAKVW